MSQLIPSEKRTKVFIVHGAVEKLYENPSLSVWKNPSSLCEKISLSVWKNPSLCPTEIVFDSCR
jgi:hypothetical protein